MNQTIDGMANKRYKDRGVAQPVLTKAGITKQRRRLRCGGKKRD